MKKNSVKKSSVMEPIRTHNNGMNKDFFMCPKCKRYITEINQEDKKENYTKKESCVNCGIFFNWED